MGGLWQRLKGSSGGGGGGGGGGSSSSSTKSASKERLVYALSKAPASLLSSLRDHKRRTSMYMPLPGSLQAGGGGGAGAAAALRQAESAVHSEDEGSSSSSPPRTVTVGAPAAAAPAAAAAAATQPPPSGPTLAIILDCSRVLEMDSTACKEVLAIIREFYSANARAAAVDREAGLASASAAEQPPPAPSGGAEPPPTELAAAAAAAAATATAASAAAATAATAAALASRKAEGLGAHTKLLLSSMPGPVRDTLDRFNRGELDLASTRFLSLAAAVAYLRELEEEKEEWGDVAEGLAALPLGDRELDGSLFFR